MQDNLYFAPRYRRLVVDSHVIVDDPSSNLLVAVALVMVLNSHVAGPVVVLY